MHPAYALVLLAATFVLDRWLATSESAFMLWFRYTLRLGITVWVILGWVYQVAYVLGRLARI